LTTFQGRKTVGDTEPSSAGPSEFLGQLAADLEARAGTDKHLAKVLVEHLLTPSPKADCVTAARLAINDLAKARAATPAQDPQDADRLMDDAVQLEFQERGGARLAICMLAQEEYAKAFLLYMVREELLPWDTELLRAIRNHACKHLVAIVMEYVDPQWETIEELDAIIKAEFDLEGRFPPRVSSALNILYHEKIRRGDFFDDNDYEPDVVAVAIWSNRTPSMSTSIKAAE
jgi:hypothetical protein